jgi:hypothetical protein
VLFPHEIRTEAVDVSSSFRRPVAFPDAVTVGTGLAHTVQVNAVLVGGRHFRRKNDLSRECSVPRK